MAVTRRKFLSLAGSTALGAQAAYALTSAFRAPRFAYVAAKGKASGLYVFALYEREWQFLHFLPAEEPVALGIHRDGRTLYVLHEVAIYRTLPRGYVSAYRVSPQSPQPVLLGVQPLSLSATSPRHFAISPNGRLLIVSAQGGGAYNVFPIADDGSIGCVCGIRKQVGCGPSAHLQPSARPQTVLFTRKGDCILGIDQGNDTISFLEGDSSLRVRARIALPPGTAASCLALHHDSQTGFISRSLSQTILAFRYDASSAAITAPAKVVAEGVSGPLTLHPTCKVFYALTNRGVAVYDFQQADTICPIQHLGIDDGVLQGESLKFSAPLNALFLATREGLLRMAANPVSGRLQAPKLIASVTHAQSVVFL